MKTQLSQRSSEKLSDDLKYNLFGTSFPLSNYIFSVWSGGRRPKAEAAASGQMVYSPQSSPPPGWTGSVSGFGNATAFGGVGSTSSVCQSISSTNKAIDLGTQTISAGSAVGAKAGTSATGCVQLMYCTQFK